MLKTRLSKTYVYLRTIHELNRQYGFKKFIIVVPSLAIKEGVLKNLQITKEHFDMLYEKPEIDFYLYDPKKRGLARNFATTNSLQVLVLNIDQFSKADNIIHQESDWGRPIDYIQAVNPIVIVDEPQNMETEKRRAAIANLNPLCTLRYSATHKYHYNLIYSLDPVRAYDLGLVKKIEVDGIEELDNANQAYVELKAVKIQSKRPVAKIKIDVATKNGVNRKELSVRSGGDLYKVSGNRDIYNDGFIVDVVDSANQLIQFSSGRTVYAGQTVGGLNDEIMRYQIEATVRNHFEKEKQLAGRGLKVLSLFFIDRVANYRNYENGKAGKGKFAEWFEEIFEQYKKNPAYKGLLDYPVEKVHNGYFSQDKKGVLKDTGGDTAADENTYSLIMKEKERLLSIGEPLRFIFSHSALREGWDNPNVFQICTLNETQSAVKKRQEIGRGLRLPVDSEGKRVFDDTVNVLTVIANESYEDFAKQLQTEIEDECGVKFDSGRIKDKKKRKRLKLNKAVYPNYEEFRQLWEKIKHRTKYQVEYSTDELIKRAGERIFEISVRKPKLISRKARLAMDSEKIEGTVLTERVKESAFVIAAVPDILGYIQNRTKLTKDTIFRIIEKADKFGDIMKNPQEFMDLSSGAVNEILQKMMVDGIKYEKIAGQFWSMQLFEDEELYGYLQNKGGNLEAVKKPEKTVYDFVLVDSEVERQFLKELEARDDVKFYLKLPFWFKIDTPLGTYNPDWAIVFEHDRKIYFVAETKSAGEELRQSETDKIHCGKKHFANFEGVKFRAPVNSLKEVVWD
ncbi:MAG: DEAD/DEAH box helicase family protein [Phycisphaerae bacterium]|nr:DEAD/DEAH box helicase family protein [Phycisphaerae bacterium]